jgi:hypothetical protein
MAVRPVLFNLFSQPVKQSRGAFGLGVIIAN